MNLKPMEVKKLSDTGWSCQYSMCSTVLKRFGAIIGLLEYRHISNVNIERAYEAKCSLGMIDKKCILVLTFIIEILKHCKNASAFLQNSKNSQGDAVRIIDTMVENITALKNDEICGHLEKIYTDLTIEHDINKYEKPKRKVNLPIAF